MNDSTRIKMAVYGHDAETGVAPTPPETARRALANVESVLAAYRALRGQRVLVLEADGSSIRMAPPFSGVPTDHVVVSGGIRYYANCAWDALGVLAALHQPGTVHSHCAQSGETFRLNVDAHRPEASDWLFHSLVPAARWWDDIVFT